MITSIKLENIASYTQKTSLNTDKKINLVYGLNGAGKTTLANFLKNKSHFDFQKCSITGGETSKILVYNQKFINDNFYERDDLKGVFTVSEANVEAKENIEKAKVEIEKLKPKQQAKEDELEKINGERGNKKKKRSEVEATIWNIKTTFSGGDRILDYCLDGVKNSKISLFNHLIELSKPLDKPTRTAEELKKEISAIDGDKTIEIPLLLNITLNELRGIESNPIFDEIIVGNKDSIVANLIEKLKNSDWLKQGLNYLPDEIYDTENCPFCQQKTITKGLANQIRNYFDKTYEARIDTLASLHSQYQTVIRKAPSLASFLVNKFADNSKLKLENLHIKLMSILSQNVAAIENKIKFPSNKEVLQDSSKALYDFNELIEIINKEITEHNQKIQNKKAVRESVKKEFWDIMRWKYDAHIQAYKSALNELEEEENKIQKALKDIQSDIKHQEGIIEDNQNRTVNIEAAIISINNQLIMLGLHGFEIKPYQNEFYRIVRENKSEPEFKSLSEGEKMIISFLYFVELCKGKESEQERVQNKIIVIDDPISSLSHNYVFNIAQLIKNEFLKTQNYLQVFVLTHSMYFFHELCKITKNDKKLCNDKKLFRVIRSNDKSSLILEMSENEIQNDYQAYWQILKDHENGKANDHILANAMRNILENFFGFIDKAKLRESINKLDPIKHEAFIRYIDRESHSDLTNISDFKEIDVSLFKQGFKTIFEESGNGSHYEKMMET